MKAGECRLNKQPGKKEENVFFSLEVANMKFYDLLQNRKALFVLLLFPVLAPTLCIGFALGLGSGLDVTIFLPSDICSHITVSLFTAFC